MVNANPGKIFSDKKAPVFSEGDPNEIVKIDPNDKNSQSDESVIFEIKTVVSSPEVSKNEDKFYQAIKQQKYDLITGKLAEFWKLSPGSRQRQNKLFTEIFSVCQKFLIEEFGEEEIHDLQMLEDMISQFKEFVDQAADCF